MVVVSCDEMWHGVCCDVCGVSCLDAVRCPGQGFDCGGSCGSAGLGRWSSMCVLWGFALGSEYLCMPHHIVSL